jgi:hypothetical protein
MDGSFVGGGVQFDGALNERWEDLMMVFDLKKCCRLIVSMNVCAFFKRVGVWLLGVGANDSPRDSVCSSSSFNNLFDKFFKCLFIKRFSKFFNKCFFLFLVNAVEQKSSLNVGFL